MEIQVMLFVDRLFYDESGKERVDAFSRVIISLAHEIYGVVQQYLSLDYKQVKPMTLEMRAKAQVQAFETSVLFLEELLKHPRFTDIPQKVRSELEILLLREKKGLDIWLKGLRMCKAAFN